jgi:hypothetical protein
LTNTQPKPEKLSTSQVAVNDLLMVAPKTTSYYLNSPFGDAIDPYTKTTGTYVINKASEMLSALVQLAGTVDDMRTVSAMFGKFPWDEKRVSRAKHLELTWFLFQNLCYKFKEKTKLVYNCQKLICRTFGLSEPNWLKFELKNVERTLGAHIQDRGNTVHNWNVQHKDIDFLAMVELMRSYRSAGQEIDLPDGFFDLNGHYRDTRFLLKRAARQALEDAEGCLERILIKHDPAPKTIIKKTEKLVDQILKQEIVLREPGK